MVGYRFVQGKMNILLVAGVDYIAGASQNALAGTANSFNPVGAGGFGSNWDFQAGI